MSHHLHGPSKLPTRFACEGSPIMEDGQPELKDEFAGLGDGLHEAIESGDLSEIDEEDQPLAVVCLEALTSLAPLKLWKREIELDLIKGDKVLLYGTLDAALIEFDSAVICDWKFGYIPVTDCANNWQMRAYAAMVMQEYDVDTVQAYIIQPRINQQSEVTWCRAELEQFVLQINALLERMEHPGCTLAAGDHCRYCKASPICPEHRREFTAVAGTSTKEIDDPVTIAKYLELGSLGAKWYDKVRHRAEQLAYAGVEIPGYYLQNKQGSAKISDANAAYQALVTDGVLTHEQFMDEVKLTIGKLEDKNSRQMRVEKGQTLKEGKESFYSQTWVNRGSDTQVLTKSRKKKEN